ncbi:MAG TPA: biotin--[acetyl-CoA-carboxylase] ligase [Methylomirabilota bacterium]|nr:biotin--[acetyl-CoA-carboxylase] ligase [Methylomirabilota bacterium]
MRFLGVSPEVHESLGSTNDEAFRRAQEGAPEGLIVLAGHQTSGKGRLGRTWYDDPDRSLMFSILLRPPIPLQSYPLLSLALASSIAWAASDTAGDIAIKWPNDVLHRGKKLSGVLAESRVLRPGETPVLVLGAGVNVNYRERDFPAELRTSATSLAMASGEEPMEMGWLFSGILLQFARLLSVAYESGPIGLLQVLRPELPEPGSTVKIALPNRVVEGELLELTDTGALRVRDRSTGALETLTAGVME